MRPSGPRPLRPRPPRLRPLRRRLLAATVAAAAVLGAPAVTAGAAAPPVTRLAGGDRFATAAAVAEAAFGPGVPVVHLATGRDFPDALAAGPAAALARGPVLLTERDSLPPATRDALVRLRPARIVLLGGTGAVGDGVVAQVAAATGAPVERVAGGDRFETAAAIAATVPTGSPVVYVASGLGFADALTAAAAAAHHGAPLLLVRPDGVPAATAAQLARFAPSMIVVAGGTTAVSATVETQLAATAPVVRLAGGDRYATAVAIAANSFDAPAGGTVHLATGQDFPDALAGSVLAGRTPGPLLLTRPDCMPPEVKAEIERRSPARVVVLGGESAVGGGAAALTACAPPPPPPLPPGGLRPGTTIAIGSIQTFGFGGHLGADWLDAGGRQICAPAGCGTYWAVRTFTTGGVVEGGGVPVEPAGVAMGRIELYPDLRFGHLDSYDPWDPALTVGGLHLWNPDGRAVDGLVLPHASNGAGVMGGTITDGGVAVADGRVQVIGLQHIPQDATPGAFGVATNRGGRWTIGWIWPGVYELFVIDTATDRTVHATVPLDPSAPVAIDLARPCFGLSGC